MSGIAKVTLIGNLGRDAETRYTPSGALNVQWSMAVNRKVGDQERVTWFRVTAWGKLAETMDALSQRGALVKGKQVYVEGTIELREYQDQHGQTRSSLDVNAREVQLLGAPGGERGDESGGARDFDDVPF